MPIGERRVVKSRSSGRLVSAVAEFATSHPEIVLIAPTHSAGEELAHQIGGAAGIHVLTLLQLASDLARPAMADLGLAPLTGLGREAIAARVVHETRSLLGYFAPVAGMPGFARALARTIGELRLAGVAAEDLSACGPAGEDLKTLLVGYEAELEERSLADAARVFELATEASTASRHRWLGLPLALLDVPLDAAAHRTFLAGIAARAPVVFAGVGTGDGVEEILGVGAEDLDPPAPASALEHLRMYLFSAAPAARAHDRLPEVFSAPGEGLEAVEIARRILRLAAEGRAFDDIAILLRSPERYQPMIDDALRRARIPAYFSRGPARPDPGGRAFLALLACAAEKCSASRFAEYLSLGQVPPTGFEPAKEWVPADDEMLSGDSAEIPEPEIDEARVARAPARWEKLLVDAAVIGGRDRWQRRLRGLQNELELRLKTIERVDETQRDHLARQLELLRELEQFALPLIETLDGLPKAAHWNEWIVRLSDLARLALRRPEPVLAVLAEFEPMGDVGPLGLDEVAEVLSERLRFLRRDPPHRRYGRVFVGSIDEARAREFGVVFLPGLAEGLFPQRTLEDPLLLDEFRKALGARLDRRDDRTRQERARLAIAASAARERLIASYPRMDVAEARPRVPSFYALELPRAIEGKLPGLKEFERRTREASPARLNWPAPSEIEDAIDDAEYDLAMLARASDAKGRARYLVESNPHLARSLRARWKRWEPKWTEADGLITSEAGTLAALAQQRLRARPWSPSSLQDFAACPYKFALHGIYGLRAREEAVPIEQMDPLTRGGLFHETQFALLGRLKELGLLPVNAQNLVAVLLEADRALDATAARYADDLAPAIPRVWSSEIEDLRTDLRGWLHHVAANDDDWTPVHFEFAFGLPMDEGRDAASTTEAAELDGVLLRGAMDLVERHVSRGTLRVTDHKTGKLPETTPSVVGGGRFLQPLLYGMAAEKLLGAKVECGRLLYATQKGGYQPIEIPLDDRRRAFLAKLLADIDGAIANGFLPPVPQKGACEACDYREVCGPYEERRLACKDRRDERLEALFEIRGMA